MCTVCNTSIPLLIQVSDRQVMQEAEKAKQQGIAHSLDISPRQDGIIKLLYYKQLVSHKYEHC